MKPRTFVALALVGLGALHLGGCGKQEPESPFAQRERIEREAREREAREMEAVEQQYQRELPGFWISEGKDTIWIYHFREFERNPGNELIAKGHYYILPNGEDSMTRPIRYDYRATVTKRGLDERMKGTMNLILTDGKLQVGGAFGQAYGGVYERSTLERVTEILAQFDAKPDV